MAFLALFWIIIWIIWTWVLILFSGNNTTTEQTLTAEEYLQLQQLINSQSGITIDTTATWAETLTWETK